MNRLADAAKPP